MTWTEFRDMHSGGGQKLDWARIYIEAPQADAEAEFEARFERSPWNITRDCCGHDYAVTEAATLQEATAYDRGCASGLDLATREWRYLEHGRKGAGAPPYLTLAAYLASGAALVIYAHELRQPALPFAAEEPTP